MSINGLENLYRKPTQKDYDDAFNDVDWIMTALTDSSYLLVKGDDSNMFQLCRNDINYINLVIDILVNDKGLKREDIHITGDVISIETERTKARKQRMKSRGNEVEK